MNSVRLPLCIILVVLESVVSELKTQFQVLMNMPSSESGYELKVGLMKDMMKQFIEKGIQSNISKDDISKCLTKVHTDLQFSKEVYEWTIEHLESLSTEVSSHGFPGKEKIEMPLFCENTIYHASLCCRAVMTKDVTNYKKLFDESKHQFDEISMSISHENVDRYIIARKGQVYFIAFRSEPYYSEWPKHFQSFEHGNNFC